LTDSSIWKYLADFVISKSGSRIILFLSAMLFENPAVEDGRWISDKYKTHLGFILRKGDRALTTRCGILINKERSDFDDGKGAQVENREVDRFLLLGKE
jgi:hypothetical protein